MDNAAPLLNSRSNVDRGRAQAKELLERELADHGRAFEATAQMLNEPFEQVLEILVTSMRRGGKLLLFGNGGSSADAQHIAAELVVRYKLDRAPIAAIALTTDSSVLTACGNDLGFEAVFERQIEGIGQTERRGSGSIHLRQQSKCAAGPGTSQSHWHADRRSQRRQWRQDARRVRRSHRSSFAGDGQNPGNAHYDRSCAVHGFGTAPRAGVDLAR